MRRRPRLYGRFAAAAILGGSALFLADSVSSDQVTLTTYYPAPSGVYTRMITTDATWLARDGGAVAVGTTANPGFGAKLIVAGGSVGLGTNTPSRQLHVVGGLRLEDGTQAPGRFLASDASGNGAWQSLPPALTAANMVTRSAYAARGAGYVSVDCVGDQIMVSGGCNAVDICSGNDWSGYGGFPSGNGWACPRWGCNNTTAYARCYDPTP